MLKMGCEETENYIWSITDKLGEGATAIVYKGMNKNNGASVAIKHFPKHFDTQEIKVLQRIDHENIVKFLDVEQSSKGDKVIIMEFCNGSSLLKVINHPENALGLDDSEFLLVLRNLHNGIKYLRDNHLIHRDLKPDNIMKCIQEDGTNIYKIGDFGVARELEDGEKFKTICGTEEYLHPAVYEEAFLTQENKSFNGTTDLWSVGVTLYHLATGKIPFRPYAGRSNKDKSVMYNILTRKESGVIAGIQRESNGTVIYENELPKDCLLSSSLKTIVTPLLAGLMESDLNKAWGYEQFFAQVKNILSKKSIYIFYINEIQLLTFYVSLEEPYEVLQDLIMNQTGVKAADQMIFFKTGILSVATISDLPLTTLENPLFLFSKDNNDVVFINEDTNFGFPEFSNKNEVQADAQLCTFYLKIGYRYKREIEKYCLHGRLIVRAFENFTNYLAYETAALLTKAEFLEEKLVILKTIFKFLHKQKNLTSELTAGTLQRIISLQQSNGRLKVVLEGLTKRVDDSRMTRSIIQSTTLVELLNKSRMKFIEDKVILILSKHEQILHNVEKKIAYRLLKKIQTLLADDVRPLHKKLSEDGGDWYKTAHCNFLTLEILKGDLVKLERTVQVHYEEFESNCTNNSGEENLKFKTSLIHIQNIMDECKNRNDYKRLLKDSNYFRNLLLNQNSEIERYMQTLDFDKIWPETL